MTLDAKAGDRFNADSSYRALLAQLSTNELEPEPETEALRRHIMTTASSGCACLVGQYAGLCAGES